MLYPKRRWPWASSAVGVVARVVTVREIARNLAEQYGEPLIASHYGIAEKFHANFYHDFMEEEEIEEDQPMIRQLVHRLIEIVEDYTPDTES